MSVVAKTPDSQSGNLGSVPGAPAGPPSRSSLRGRYICSNWDGGWSLLKDCECICVWLYDGWRVAYAANVAMPYSGFMQLYVVWEDDSILRRQFEFTFTSTLYCALKQVKMSLPDDIYYQVSQTVVARPCLPTRCISKTIELGTVEGGLVRGNRAGQDTIKKWTGQSLPSASAERTT